MMGGARDTPGWDEMGGERWGRDSGGPFGGDDVRGVDDLDRALQRVGSEGSAPASGERGGRSSEGGDCGWCTSG